jgi:hypothetical protein
LAHCGPEHRRTCRPAEWRWRRLRSGHAANSGLFPSLRPALYPLPALVACCLLPALRSLPFEQDSAPRTVLPMPSCLPANLPACLPIVCAPAGACTYVMFCPDPSPDPRACLTSGAAVGATHGTRRRLAAAAAGEMQAPRLYSISARVCLPVATPPHAPSAQARPSEAVRPGGSPMCRSSAPGQAASP